MFTDGTPFGTSDVFTSGAHQWKIIGEQKILLFPFILSRFCLLLTKLRSKSIKELVHKSQHAINLLAWASSVLGNLLVVHDTGGMAMTQDSGVL